MWLLNKIRQFITGDLSLEELLSIIDLKPGSVNSQLRPVESFFLSRNNCIRFLSLLNISSRKNVLKYLQRIDYDVIASNTFVSLNTVSKFFTSDSEFSINQNYLYKFAIILDVPFEILCKKDLNNIKSSFNEYLLQDLNHFTSITEIVLYSVNLLNNTEIDRNIDGCTFSDPKFFKYNKLYLARLDIRNEFFTIDIFFNKSNEISYFTTTLELSIKEALKGFNVNFYIQDCLFREEVKFVILCYKENTSLDKLFKKLPVADRTFLSK